MSDRESLVVSGLVYDGGQTVNRQLSLIGFRLMKKKRGGDGNDGHQKFKKYRCSACVAC